MQKFINEISNHQKIKIFVISIVIAIVLIGLSVAIFSTFKSPILSSQPFKNTKSFVENEVLKLTPIGLFYLSFFGGFFFLFSPIELLFLKSLANGNQILFTLTLVMAGTLLAQAVNYFIGSRFSKIVFNIISKKRVYKAKRAVNKYGKYAIFLFSLLPLPIDILTFALGIAKYNLLRLYVFLFIGNLIKFGLLIGFYLAFM